MPKYVNANDASAHTLNFYNEKILIKFKYTNSIFLITIF